MIAINRVLKPRPCPPYLYGRDEPWVTLVSAASKTNYCSGAESRSTRSREWLHSWFNPWRKPKDLFGG